MSIKVVSWIRDYVPLGGASYWVLHQLGDWCDDEGLTRYGSSIPRLAANARVSVRQCQRALVALECGGVVVRAARGGGRGNRGNQWRIVMESEKWAEPMRSGVRDWRESGIVVKLEGLDGKGDATSLFSEAERVTPRHIKGDATSHKRVTPRHFERRLSILSTDPETVRIQERACARMETDGSRGNRPSNGGDGAGPGGVHPSAAGDETAVEQARQDAASGAHSHRTPAENISDIAVLEHRG